MNIPKEGQLVTLKTNNNDMRGIYKFISCNQEGKCTIKRFTFIAKNRVIHEVDINEIIIIQ
jgi:hypothetical protein